MANGKQAEAMADFILRPTMVRAYVRRDGAYTVWLPQDKRTWRIDDKFGGPVTDDKGKALRFMSCETAMVAAAALP